MMLCRREEENLLLRVNASRDLCADHINTHHFQPGDLVKRGQSLVNVKLRLNNLTLSRLS